MSEVAIFISIYVFAGSVGMLLAIMLLRRADTSDDMDEHYWRDM